MILLLLLCVQVFSSVADCPDRKCADECPFGFAKDPLGCQTCDCCQLPFCPPWCRGGFGYTASANGCTQCTCNGCPLFSCPTNCTKETFTETQADGCKVCACKEEAKTVCGPVKCPPCTSGMQTVVNDVGCTVCKCIERSVHCENVACPANCSEHFKIIDEKGCESCVCISSCRSANKCPSDCRYGTTKVEENGCTVCRCKTNPNCQSLKYCNTRGCPVKKINGCTVCKCGVQCRRRCRHGYKTLLGVESCWCCLDKRCRQCKDGYELDRSGCKTCRCKKRKSSHDDDDDDGDDDDNNDGGKKRNNDKKGKQSRQTEQDGKHRK